LVTSTVAATATMPAPSIAAATAARPTGAGPPARLPPAIEELVMARDYGYSHQVRRRRIAPRVAAGIEACAHCGELIAPGEPWELAKEAGDYIGPAHQRCNRSRHRHSRDW
jgi:hypothetical protein